MRLKKIVSVHLALVLLFAIFFGVLDLTIEGKGGYFGGGAGTAEDPFLIEDISDLQNVRSNLSAHYVLTNNIDASETKNWNNGRGLIPIGTQWSEFEGSLDGQNYTIRDLFIKREATPFLGLFGWIGFSGIVRNVCVDECNISGGDDIGGIAGINEGVIDNCISKGSVNGEYSVGGLVGANNGYIIDSISISSVTGYSGIGGLIGYSSGTVGRSWARSEVSGLYNVGGLIGRTQDGNIIRSSSAGHISGTRDYIGGFSGFNGNGWFWGCGSDCTITGGRTYVGGFLGYDLGGIFTDCVSIANISGSSSVVGGFAGFSHGSLNNCSFAGIVFGNTFVGGLAGANLGTIRVSNANGYVSGQRNVGGLTGYNDKYLDSSYFETGIIEGEENTGGLYGENYGTVSNSHYNIDDVRINGKEYITAGGLFDQQYNDWLTNGLSLNISHYADTLVPEDEHYSISNVEGLKDLLGFAEDNELSFHLVSDIDLSEQPGLYIPFFGAKEFEGNHHTISHLKIDQPFSVDIGMFGRSDDSIIRNLSLIDIDVKGYNGTGGLVGVNFDSVIENISATGDVTGERWVGGLIGYAFGPVGNSTFQGTVIGVLQVGGLVGTGEGLVNHSSFNGLAFGDNYIGGLMGGNLRGEVSYSNSSGFSTGNKNYVGGLVGHNEGDISLSFSSSLTKGDTYVGGLVGYNRLGLLNNTFALGNIAGKDCIGGLIGRMYDGNISNSYSIGAMFGTDEVGGLIGSAYKGTVYNSFWDAHRTYCVVSQGGTGKSTAEMMTRSTFTGSGWDFTNIWCIIENETYPILRWQDTECPDADAGEDQVVNEGDLVYFDGSSCCDDIGIAEYVWTFIDQDEEMVLTGSNPTYQFMVPGIYNVTLKVRDIVAKCCIDNVSVTVKDTHAPVSYAGPDITIDEDTPLTLDGTGSSDNVGIVNYTWTFVNGTGNVTLYGPTNSFIFKEPGEYPISLKVRDAEGLFSIDTFILTVNDITPPEANAGEDQILAIGTRIMLDGTNSTDNGGIADYRWDFAYNGELNVLHGEIVSFELEKAGLYQITLTVTDLSGNNDVDIINIKIVETGIVTGVVLGKNGLPVEGAVVEITAFDGMPYTTSTEQDGSFWIEVPYGSFSWKISKSGYKTVSGSSMVVANGERELNLTNSPLEKEEGMGLLFLLFTIPPIILVLIVVGVVALLVIRRKKKEPVPEEVEEGEEGPGKPAFEVQVVDTGNIPPAITGIYPSYLDNVESGGGPVMGTIPDENEKVFQEGVTEIDSMFRAETDNIDNIFQNTGDDLEEILQLPEPEASAQGEKVGLFEYFENIGHEENKPVQEEDRGMS